MFLNLELKNKNSIAVIDDSETSYSYGELIDFSSEIFASINKRTLVFILSENNFGSLAAYYAFLNHRVVPLIISANYNSEATKQLIETYKPEYLWLPTKNLDRFEYKETYSKYEYSLVETKMRPDDLHEDLSLLLSTSGSTGSPKLVRHSYSNVNANAKNVASFFNIEQSDVAIAILPMNYTMGLSVVTSHLYAGATLLLSNKNLTDRTFWSSIKKYKATSFTGVPFSYEILQKLRFFRMDLPDLKLITQGGGKLSKDLFITCAEYAHNNGKQFIATYGQTEGTARMAYLPAQKAKDKIGSIGKAIPEGELIVIDEEGKEILTPNTSGELVYRGPNVTMGYALNASDLNKGDENHGTLKTGDIAIKDKEGYFYIVGRKTRFLKLFGIRISLDELQYLIKEKFEVDCACMGDDTKMLVLITNESLIEDVKNFIINTTKLFHKAFEVKYVNQIKRNTYGKIILN